MERHLKELEKAAAVVAHLVREGMITGRDAHLRLQKITQVLETAEVEMVAQELGR